MPAFPLVYVGVAAVATAAGGIFYLGKNADGGFEQISQDVYDQALEQGVPILESIAEEIKAGLIALGGSVGAALESGLVDLADALEELGPEILQCLEQVGASIANATLQVLEFAGPRIIDGLDNTYDYIRTKLRGKEPQVITALTGGLLTVLTGTYLLYAARRGTLTFSE